MDILTYLKPDGSIHRKIYLGALALLACSIPVSTVGMSVSQIILIINWLWERDFQKKWNILRKNRAIQVFLSIYLIHLIGLTYTSWPEGFYGPGYNAADDLRIKLPLLILPIIIGTSEGLSFKEIKTVIYLFSISLFISSLVSTAAFLGIIQRDISDIRKISFFISHIRFSLLINVAIFSFGYFLYREFQVLKFRSKLILIAGIFWFVSFLFVLKSFTGIFVFAFLLLFSCTLLINRIQHFWIKIGIYFGIVLPVLILSIILLMNVIRLQTTRDPLDRTSLDKFTANGRPYTQEPANLQVENGHWVGIYINKEELRKEWNQRSQVDFDGKDFRGNYLYQTLSRYLSAMDLRKDSAGVSKLSPEDIGMIEQGFANPVYKKKYSIYPRLYEIIWELDLYFRGGSPNGHSVSQRIEFNITGWKLFQKHPWAGVGTGDVSGSYKEQYQEMNTRLADQNQKRSHNQYLTFLIAFGAFGFLWILFSMFFPVFYQQKWKNYLFVSTFLMALLSMLTEDTLETQAGATFFTFFYILFLFGSKSE